MAFGTTFASKGFRSLAVGMAFLLALGACANTNDPTLTPAERQLRQESNKFAQTTAEGAVFGALAGLAIGYLAGGARGAAIGADRGLTGPSRVMRLRRTTICRRRLKTTTIRLSRKPATTHSNTKPMPPAHRRWQIRRWPTLRS